MTIINRSHFTQQAFEAGEKDFFKLLPYRQVDIYSSHREYSKVATIAFLAAAILLRAFDLPGKNDFLICAVFGAVWFAIANRNYQTALPQIQKMLSEIKKQ